MAWRNAAGARAWISVGPWGSVGGGGPSWEKLRRKKLELYKYDGQFQKKFAYTCLELGRGVGEVVQALKLKTAISSEAISPSRLFRSRSSPHCGGSRVIAYSQVISVDVGIA